MEPTRTVGATERTRDVGRMDGQIDGWMDGRMDRRTEISIPPNNFVVRGV